MKTDHDTIEELKDTLAAATMSVRDFHTQHVAPYGYDYAEFLRQINTDVKLNTQMRYIISNFLRRQKR